MLGHQQGEIGGGGEGGDVVEIREGKANKESAEKKGPICAMESGVLKRRMGGQSN